MAFEILRLVSTTSSWRRSRCVLVAALILAYSVHRPSTEEAALALRPHCARLAATRGSPARRCSAVVRPARKEKTFTREDLPAAVGLLTSAEFLAHLRDGGPAAIQPVNLPPVDLAWIGYNEPDTVRNVVNALCKHRFGPTVFVDEVFSSGRDYLVTLTLTDKTIFGSCECPQVRDFDKSARKLIEGLEELDGWREGWYKLNVRTPGSEGLLDISTDLWKCSFFPCGITLRRGEKHFLNRVPNSTSTWQLANCQKNTETGILTKAQQRQRFTIKSKDIRSAHIYIDSSTQKVIRKARSILDQERKERVGNETGLQDHEVDYELDDVEDYDYESRNPDVDGMCEAEEETEDYESNDEQEASVDDDDSVQKQQQSAMQKEKTKPPTRKERALADKKRVEREKKKRKARQAAKKMSPRQRQANKIMKRLKEEAQDWSGVES